MMDGKPIKEELQEKEYQSAADVARRAKTSNGKERRSPEPDETRPPSVGGNGVASPTNNGTAESLSPPLGDAGARGSPALHKLRRFLSTLLQFASDISLDAGDRVRSLIHNLLSGGVSIDEFQSSVQESTNYPLRASVPGFLRALLPHAQRDLLALARHAKQTPLQYIRSHEHLVLESGGGDSGDIFASQPDTRRRAADPFYESGSVPNGQAADAEYTPPAKRPLLLNPSPFLYPLPGAHLLEYAPTYQPPPHATAPDMLTFESRSRDGIAVRDVGSLTAPPAAAPLAARTDDEWRNINTMLNCILSMVEKTKRALAILQQRGSSAEPPESSDIKRVCGEIMAATVRQTEERVAEVRRRAEDAVNQVKRQALAELQRAAGAAEARAGELVAAERGRMERLLQDAGRSPPAGERSPPPPPLPAQAAPSAQQNCWNCGRKAQETCSGCNAARYCGAFCQHKDWENHHQVCCGRDLKPTTTLTTSPPVTQPNKPLARSTTPINSSAPVERHAINSERIALPTERHPLTDRHPLTERHQLPTERLPTESRLSLTTLNNAERMLATSERPLSTSSDRLTLATLSTAQGLIGGIGGKK